MLTAKKQTPETIRLGNRFEGDHLGMTRVFELNMPLTITICKGTGYRKIGAIGGEEFTAFGAYSGQKGDVIVIFKPTRAMSYDSMEMKLNDAMENLKGFRRYIQSINDEDEEAVVKGARAEAEKLESGAYFDAVKTRLQDDPRFGSW